MAILAPIQHIMDTKDRIKQIMEDQKMTQQQFADFLQQSPATLSSIFNGRTRPTLNIVDAIKAKIPDISIEWLLYGSGDMYVSHPDVSPDVLSTPSANGQDLMLNFDAPAPVSPNSHQNPNSVANYQQGVKTTHPEYVREEIRLVDKEPRRVTEIRVYYDDQTYETFVPAKK
jgi:DNA-binding XRE family transcriptional regulator